MSAAFDEVPNRRKTVTATETTILDIALKVDAGALAAHLPRRADVPTCSTVDAVEGGILARAIATYPSVRAGVLTRPTMIGITVEQYPRTLAIEATAKGRVTHVSAESTERCAGFKIHALPVANIGKTWRTLAAPLLAGPIGGYANRSELPGLATPDTAVLAAAAAIFIIGIQIGAIALIAALKMYAILIVLPAGMAARLELLVNQRADQTER